MKILLRDKDSGRFYRGASQWTLRQLEALDLEQVCKAVELASDLHLEHAEIVASFDSPPQNIVLALE